MICCHGNSQVAINQRYIQNSFYNNFAFAENRSTIHLKSAKFSFRDNYLINRLNRYEIVTFNRTKSVLAGHRQCSKVSCCTLSVTPGWFISMITIIQV